MPSPVDFGVLKVCFVYFLLLFVWFIVYLAPVLHYLSQILRIQFSQLVCYELFSFQPADIIVQSATLVSSSDEFLPTSEKVLLQYYCF